MLAELVATVRASGQNSEAVSVSQKYGYLLADLDHEDDSVWGSKLGAAIIASYRIWGSDWVLGLDGLGCRLRRGFRSRALIFKVGYIL